MKHPHINSPVLLQLDVRMSFREMKQFSTVLRVMAAHELPSFMRKTGKQALNFFFFCPPGWRLQAISETTKMMEIRLSRPLTRELDGGQRVPFTDFLEPTGFPPTSDLPEGLPVKSIVNFIFLLFPDRFRQALLKADKKPEPF